MPKVKLNRDIKKEQTEYRRNLIESKYHSRGYRAQTEVERALGVSQGWLSRRLRGEGISLDDLNRIDNLLLIKPNTYAIQSICKIQHLQFFLRNVNFVIIPLLKPFITVSRIFIIFLVYFSIIPYMIVF